ncbi:MAG: hypothetical protein LBH51_03560, partial [Treponema sp.]|nr:hypothetical protein [Treponema sp.]
MAVYAEFVIYKGRREKSIAFLPFFLFSVISLETTNFPKSGKFKRPFFSTLTLMKFITGGSYGVWLHQGQHGQAIG